MSEEGSPSPRGSTGERLRTLRKTYSLRASVASSKEPTGSREHSQVDRAMREFEEYIKSLEGQDELTESSIRAMFTNSVCTQRLPTEPLRIVELDRVPPGLQRPRTIVRPAEMIPWDRVQTSKRGTYERPKYGAWYLPPSAWRAGQSQSKDSLFPENPDLKRRSDALKEELGRLQGARLFRDYLAQQHAHIPRLLESRASNSGTADPARASAAATPARSRVGTGRHRPTTIPSLSQTM